MFNSLFFLVHDITAQQEKDLTLLSNMYHVPDAGYLCGDRQGCMEGTREDVLSDINSWLNDKEDKRVFWLNGLAGTGKSTIAQTFAERSFAEGRLGASFFCSRDFEERSNLRSIFPTLAFQLAHQYPHFQEALLLVLRKNPDVHQESLFSQIEKLIVAPVCVAQISTLIIIDALDECQDKEPASALLSVLARHVDKIPLVKFFITGRPEPQIRTGFRLKLLQPYTEVFRLHEVEKSSVDSDINLYFKTQFLDMIENRSDCSLADDWPGQHNIDILCKKAGRLFIYASTMVKFIASRYHLPDERLALVASLPNDTSHEGREGIDNLYTQVLVEGFCDADSRDHNIYSHLKFILGAVVLAFYPLSIKTLSDLLGDDVTPSRVFNSLRTLHSVLLIPENQDNPIRTIHKSFPDFLTDPSRCTNNNFFIDPSIHHKKILLSCLSIMKHGLKLNICNFDHDVDLRRINDLPSLRNIYIGDALEYACKFWTSHLAKSPSSGHDFEEINEAITEFFTTNFLFWIEILILTKNLDAGVYALNDVEQWYMLVSDVEALSLKPILMTFKTEQSCKWIRDSKLFILENFDTILHFPYQIYNVALQLCPSSSWLCQYYSKTLLQKIKIVAGPAEWRVYSRVVSINNKNFAYGNNLIAADIGGQIGILDAITGTQTTTFSEHTYHIHALAFSVDGTLLVSGGDDVKLWDVQTGGVIKTFDYDGVATSVSISADNTATAAGYSNGAICLWNIETMNGYSVKGTTNQRGPVVCFSPTNPQLLLSTFGGTGVMQWLGIDGHYLDPPIPSSYIAFSSDGTQFGTCFENTITIHSTDSGKITIKPQSHLDVRECCFSPDGKFVAYCSNQDIYIWEITGPDSPKLIKSLWAHQESLQSLAFSSSHTLITAGKGGIKFWDINHLLSIPGAGYDKFGAFTTVPIVAVSIQSKDCLAFSIDRNGVLKIWDIYTGHCKKTIQTQVKYLWSGDMQLIRGRLILVGAAENIRVWDVEERRCLATIPTYSGKVRILEDRFEFFSLHYDIEQRASFIQIWSLWTGKLMGQVMLEKAFKFLNPLRMDGSKVSVCLEDDSNQIWGFEAEGSSLIQLPTISLDNLCMHFAIGKASRAFKVVIIDGITKRYFSLPDKYAHPSVGQWDGRHVIFGYESGNVWIMDVDYIPH